MEVINTVFQVLFIAIMSIGVLGFPLYLYLNSRKKRIYAEHSGDAKPNDE